MKSIVSTKKFLSVSILGAIMASCAVTAVPASAAPSKAPPVQGNKLALVISADTVTGGGTPAPPATCAQTNFFKRGQLVVFRSWGIDVKSGGYALTPKNVKSAVVNIPGQKQTALKWVSEPYNAPPSQQVSYWEAVWVIPKVYPLGVVNFNIVFKTKRTPRYRSFTGKYSQKGFSPESQLQVTI
jgi:hypothetical protein